MNKFKWKDVIILKLHLDVVGPRNQLYIITKEDPQMAPEHTTLRGR